MIDPRTIFAGRGRVATLALLLILAMPTWAADGATQPPVPKPGDVLDTIYQIKGDGSSTYSIANGATATFWYGHRYDLKGKHYYTGFAYQTPDIYNKADEEKATAPDAKATITQGSFVLDASGKKWTALGGQPYLGEFGGGGKADEIDEKRQAQTYWTAAGDQVLAVPTVSTAAGGTDVTADDVFVLNHEDRSWKYVGNIGIGTDNGAGCSSSPSDGLPPCISSTATLEFVKPQSGDLPEIRTVPKGTMITGPGKTRTLTASDATTYRYDAKSEAYQEVKAH
ncbi:hypothetical protein [Dyella sp.]|uniref:hypothetical protein n=1 Tax=Dyella sp. TaxID=1869338 RepID=UPI002ED04ED5